MRAGIRKKRSRGRSAAGAITLRSPRGRVVLTLEPRAGLAGVSMQVDEREWLRLPEPLAPFLKHDRTGGIPLLFPWANRLPGDRFGILGRRVDLKRVARVHRDSAGRPMHGVLLRWPKWDVESATGGSSARAKLRWNAHRELTRAFPFDFELELAWRVFDHEGAGHGVEIATTVRAFEDPVPLSFGWHPYLVLPGPRARCRLATPTLARVRLEEGLPMRRTGALELDSCPAARRELPRQGIDDLFAGITDGTSISVDAESTARSLRVEFVRGYRFAQMYSPRGADFICIEPMMAPTAALSDAAPELPILGAGQRASAIFRISVIDR